MCLRREYLLTHFLIARDIRTCEEKGRRVAARDCRSEDGGSLDRMSGSDRRCVEKELDMESHSAD